MRGLNGLCAGEELEFDLVFGMADPTNRYDLARLIDTDDPDVHLLIGGRGQLFYGFLVALPVEDEERRVLSRLLAKYA